MSRIKANFIFLIYLIPIVLSHFNEPIKIKGHIGDTKIFDCPLEPIPKEFSDENFEFSLCDNFTSKYLEIINQYPGVVLTLKLKSKRNTDDFKERYTDIGPKIKKLDWESSNDSEFTGDDIRKTLKLLPSLEDLVMSSFASISDKSESPELFLKNLKFLTFYYCDQTIFEFIAEALPINQLISFEINHYSDEMFRKFFKSQKSITDLELKGDFDNFEALKVLQLKKLKIKNGSFEGKLQDKLRKGLKEFLLTQSQLEELTIPVDEYQPRYFNDEIFDVITGFDNLKVLKLEIDDVSIEKIQNLTNLKTLSVAFKNDDGFENLIKLSSVELESIENFEIVPFTNDFSLSKNISQQFAQNFKNLRSLTIDNDISQDLNFFLESFPNIEELRLKFNGSKVFTNIGQKYQNLKMLFLEFQRQKVDSEDFFALLNSFPNLDTLTFGVVFFPFNDEFLSKFLQNLGRIKDITLLLLHLPCDGEISPSTIDTFKQFKTKLTTGRIALTNEISSFGEDVDEYRCETTSEDKLEIAKKFNDLLVAPLKGTYEIKLANLFSNEYSTFPDILISW